MFGNFALILVGLIGGVTAFLFGLAIIVTVVDKILDFFDENKR